jgi:hypothetical protein
VNNPSDNFERENLLISRVVHCMPEMMIYDRMAWGYSGASIINDDTITESN